MQFLVATLTPFDRSGRLDLGRLRAHVLWLMSAGVDGFVPTGSTGELLYLSDREREAVHRTVLDTARGRPVYPCVWDASPITMAWLCDAARDQGAAGVLVPPPLYYRVEPALLAAWFRSVSAAARLPVLAYHNPTYLPTPIELDLYQELRAEGVLTGLKDSATDLWRLRRFAEAEPNSVYSGGASVLCDVHEIDGLAGHIDAIANVWPALCRRGFNGEVQLREAIAQRAAGVSRAGGFRAMKALLGMGCRAPFPEPGPEAIADIPEAESF